MRSNLVLLLLLLLLGLMVLAPGKQTGSNIMRMAALHVCSSLQCTDSNECDHDGDDDDDDEHDAKGHHHHNKLAH